jgi:hypothetical protein
VLIVALAEPIPKENPLSKSIITAAAFAVGLASLFGQGAAMAEPRCNGSVHRTWGGTIQCYYLPTVANGRVTGLQEQVNFHSYRNGPPIVVPHDYYGHGRAH